MIVPTLSLTLWINEILLIDIFQVIDQSGGQVDESYSNRITHVLCQHLRTDVVQLVSVFSLFMLLFHGSACLEIGIFVCLSSGKTLILSKSPFATVLVCKISQKPLHLIFSIFQGFFP